MAAKKKPMNDARKSEVLIKILKSILLAQLEEEGDNLADEATKKMAELIVDVSELAGISYEDLIEVGRPVCHDLLDELISNAMEILGDQKAEKATGSTGTQEGR
ncbi:MAG: hypothetical protein AB200_01075 [Parcubacteria bacterium C7867-005]|nr:MAG: hypothetical protein AB200_01075 [Parcubacteria bacterium C7867-005]